MHYQTKILPENDNLNVQWISNGANIIESVNVETQYIASLQTHGARW
ncbi:MAG: hypothetical protein JSS63_13850 [Bacteroidetes bacterium]|nr:hypothetical protein [Bacteroidota bacterium]